jgi:hypothetical protein
VCDQKQQAFHSDNWGEDKARSNDGGTTPKVARAQDAAEVPLEQQHYRTGAVVGIGGSHAHALVVLSIEENSVSLPDLQLHLRTKESTTINNTSLKQRFYEAC